MYVLEIFDFKLTNPPMKKTNYLLATVIKSHRPDIKYWHTHNAEDATCIYVYISILNLSSTNTLH